MKLFVVFAVFVTLCHGGTIPKDNSHYVEGESRYVWLSNDEGELVLEDLQEPVDGLARDTRNGINNQYWLFTRQNPSNHQVLELGNPTSLLHSNYRHDRPTKVLLHGWTNHGYSRCNTMLRDAFLAAQDCNVIVVDWSTAAGGNYISAVNNVPSVGQFVGDFLSWLVSAGSNWDRIHLSGYSLGAHVVGVAGRHVGGRPSRVTGLDPAGPLWQLNSFRLTSGAAQYVEGIHTDGLLQGIWNPVGHADFYPNGGRSPQPGCDDSSCSHARSYQFFASSIRDDRFAGRLCTSLIQAGNMQCTGRIMNMGNGVINKRGNGLFALPTGSAWPF